MRLNKPKFWDQKISLFSLILLPFTILVKLIIVLKKRLVNSEKFYKESCSSKVKMGYFS